MYDSVFFLILIFEYFLIIVFEITGRRVCSLSFCNNQFIMRVESLSPVHYTVLGVVHHRLPNN